MNLFAFKKYIPPTFKNIVREFKNNNGFKMILGEIELSMLKRSMKGGNSSRNGSKCILFYPHFPSYGYIIYNICRILGIRMTNNINDTFHLVVDWQDRTYKQSNKDLLGLAQNYRVLNIECKNIDKKHIDSIFKRVFGYSIMVNPLVFVGDCVVKSNLNGRHDGKIITCPIKRIDENCVYQKVINNQINDELVQDIRMPIFNQTIPFIYLKYRSINDRFSNTNINAKIARSEDILSVDEIKNILNFCGTIRLEYGELDILRNRDDGLLYIVDVNNAPFGPPNRMSKREKQEALKLLAKTFQEAFINN